MNAYTFIVIVVIFVYTTARPFDLDIPNVGTVLFSDKDLQKKFWQKSDIALLEARRHFQNMIPPPEMVSPGYNFVETLLDYFKQSFTLIKDTASNPEEDSLLTTALSDIIGGYLKLWILPTTKFAFYSGTITQDQAFKVFGFYEEIKKYLLTDGSGWRSPNYKILKCIVDNIPRPMPRYALQAYTRNTDEDSCEIFAYFEKTPNGFTIPLPFINWEQDTMFVPLKNQSIVHLSSSKHYNTLVEYYTAAKSCLKRRSPNITEKFDEKLQSWLFQTVLPHLTDDRLYVALGNVLMLFNDTESAYSTSPWDENLISSPFHEIKKQKETIICRLKCYLKQVWEKIRAMLIYIWHHKLATLGLLLLLEVLWCIYAMKRLDIKIKDRSFCFCKKACLFFSARGCHMPKKGPPGGSCGDGNNDNSKSYQGENKKQDSFSSSDKTSNKGSRSNSSSSSKRSGIKLECPGKKFSNHEFWADKPGQVGQTGQLGQNLRDNASSPTRSSSDLKCSETCTPCHFLEKTTSNTFDTTATGGKCTSEETTAQRNLQSKLSKEKCNNPITIQESELERILYCPGNKSKIVAAEKWVTNSCCKSECCKFDEFAQNEVASDAENKLQHMGNVDVKFSGEIITSGIKLDVIPKSKRGINESESQLNQLQTHDRYPTGTSESRNSIPNVCKIVNEVSSRSRNLPPKIIDIPQTKSKKVHKRDSAETICTSRDQQNFNIVTLFEKPKISTRVHTTIDNEVAPRKSLTRSVSIKTPFSTLHESSSSIMTEYSYGRKTRTIPSIITKTDKKTVDSPKRSMLTLVYDPNKPEREIQSHTYEHTTMATEQKTEIPQRRHSNKKTSMKLRKTDIVSQVTEIQVDEQMRQRRLERVRSRHLQDARKEEERIRKHKDPKEQFKEANTEEIKLLRDCRQEPKEVKRIHESHQKQRIKEFSKSNYSFEEIQRARAILKDEITRKQCDENVTGLNEQQEIRKEERIITKHKYTKETSKEAKKKGSKDSREFIQEPDEIKHIAECYQRLRIKESEKTNYSIEEVQRPTTVSNDTVIKEQLAELKIKGNPNEEQETRSEERIIIKQKSSIEPKREEKIETSNYRQVPGEMKNIHESYQRHYAIKESQKLNFNNEEIQRSEEISKDETKQFDEFGLNIPHQQQETRTEERIIMKQNATKEQCKLPKRDEREVSKEFRQEPGEMKDLHEFYQKHATKESQKQNYSKEEIKKSTAISKYETIIQQFDLIGAKEQQAIHKESKEPNEESSEKRSQRESRKSSRDSYVEIKIDKPDGEISVGVTGSMVGRIDKPVMRYLRNNKKTMPCVEKIEEPVQRAVRETRIPKRASRATSGSHSQSPDPESTAPNSPAAKPKSRIPQLKKRAADDMEIKDEKPTSKLNMTL